MKKRLFWLICLLFCSLQLVAQEEGNDSDEPEQEEVGERKKEKDDEKPSLRDRMYFGGNVGFSFGDIVFVDASPLVGYKLTDRFSSGVGFTYRYLKNKLFFPPLSYNLYGGRVFARYDATPVVYPYVEYEHLRFQFGDGNRNAVGPSSDAFFAGVGFTQRIGQRGGINVLTLYMLNWTRLNPVYNSPWVFRVGFQF